jgi:hypothetical protein
MVPSYGDGQPSYGAKKGINMNSKFFRIVIISILIVFTNAALSAEITYSGLVGKWRAEKPHPSGAIVAVELEITSDNTFRGIAFVNGVPNWTYNGTLQLRGNELTWSYLKSSRPMPPNYQDVDLILSIEDQKYTYRSKLSGEISSYDRIK